jgi:hypothetical protein
LADWLGVYSDIRDGWNADSQDYTTSCPSPACKERFVARFTVRPSSSAAQSLDMDEAETKKVGSIASLSACHMTNGSLMNGWCADVTNRIRSIVNI